MEEEGNFVVYAYVVMVVEVASVALAVDLLEEKVAVEEVAHGAGWEAGMDDPFPAVVMVVVLMKEMEVVVPVVDLMCADVQNEDVADAAIVSRAQLMAMEADNVHHSHEVVVVVYDDDALQVMGRVAVERR